MLVHNDHNLVTGTDHLQLNPDTQDRTYRIIIAGLPRSGSTWQYNAVRFVLSLGLGIPYHEIPATFGQVPYKNSLPRMYKCLSGTAGAGGAGGGNGGMSGNSRKYPKICVAKMHMYDHGLTQLSNYVFTSYRDPRDIYMSVRSIFPKQKPIEYLREYFGHYSEWLQYVCLDQRYEVIVNSELLAIDQIKHVLDLGHVNSTQVVELLGQALRHSKQKKGWDALTGFADTHIRYKKPGAFKGTQPQQQQQQEPSEVVEGEQQQQQQQLLIGPGTDTPNEVAEQAAPVVRGGGAPLLQKLKHKATNSAVAGGGSSPPPQPPPTPSPHSKLQSAQQPRALTRIPPEHLISIELEFAHWMRERGYALENTKIRGLLETAPAPRPLPAPPLPAPDGQPRPPYPYGQLPIDPSTNRQIEVPAALVVTQPWSFNRAQFVSTARHAPYASVVMPKRCKPIPVPQPK